MDSSQSLTEPTSDEDATPIFTRPACKPRKIINTCSVFSKCERALARLVGVRQRKPPGRGFDPCSHREKKTPSLVPCPKHSWGLALLTGNGLCTGGAGVRGFSRPAWEDFLLSVMPWGRSPPAGLVFFLASQVALFSRVFLHRYLKIKELLWDAVSYFFLDILEWIDL